jgi:hypothetical protein
MSRNRSLLSSTVIIVIIIFQKNYYDDCSVLPMWIFHIALLVSVQLLKAIQGIHELGYINRDIKPVSSSCLCMLLAFVNLVQYRMLHISARPSNSYTVCSVDCVG